MLNRLFRFFDFEIVWKLFSTNGFFLYLRLLENNKKFLDSVFGKRHLKSLQMVYEFALTVNAKS